MSNKKIASCKDEAWAHSYIETGETEVEDLYGNIEVYRTWQCAICNSAGISTKPKQYEDDIVVFINTMDEFDD